MTREKALEAMDKLVAMGYAVKLYEGNMRDHVHFVDGELTSMQRQLEVTALSLDKIDLRALIAAADELNLDVGLSPINNGNLSFTDPVPESEQRRQDATSGRRRHPR